MPYFLQEGQKVAKWCLDYVEGGYFMRHEIDTKEKISGRVMA